jgi:hypothetical protein
MGDDGRPFHRYYSGGITIRTVFAFERVCVWGGGWGTLSIIVTNSTLVSFKLIVSTIPPSSGEQTT